MRVYSDTDRNINGRLERLIAVRLPRPSESPIVSPSGVVSHHATLLVGFSLGGNNGGRNGTGSRI
jgi:hypothetical protein